MLASNAFPALLKRLRPYTVPVYDYALMSEPLSAEQLAAVGWKNRQGLADAGVFFHYFRISEDDRILWGGWDGIYHWRNGIRPALRPAPRDLRAARRASSSPCSRSCRACASRTAGAA